MITKLIAWYYDLPFFLRALGTALALAFTGSTFIGILSTYATYWFAFKHGARLPVEGIPYLAVSTAVVSFGIFMTSMLFASMMFAFIKGGMVLARREDRTLPLLISILLALTVAGYLAWYVYGRSGRPNVSESDTGSLIIAVLWSLLSIVSGMLAGYVTARPQYLNRGLSVFFLGATCVGLASMFVGDTYGVFLRMTRFGGGIEVTITDKEKQRTQAHLFLLTADRAIVFNPSGTHYTEIPTASIADIEYAQMPNWKLPPDVRSKQFDYWPKKAQN